MQLSSDDTYVEGWSDTMPMCSITVSVVVDNVTVKKFAVTFDASVRPQCLIVNVKAVL